MWWWWPLCLYGACGGVGVCTRRMLRSLRAPHSGLGSVCQELFEFDECFRRSATTSSQRGSRTSIAWTLKLRRWRVRVVRRGLATRSWRSDFGKASHFSSERVCARPSFWPGTPLCTRATTSRPIPFVNRDRAGRCPTRRCSGRGFAPPLNGKALCGRHMDTQFRRLNGEWNAEPNAPEFAVHVVGNHVILEFFANSFQFPRFSSDQRLQLRFDLDLPPRTGERWHDKSPTAGTFSSIFETTPSNAKPTTGLSCDVPREIWPS